VNRIALPDINFITSCIEPQVLQSADRRLQTARADIDTSKTPALLAKPLGDRKADATRCARDDADAVL
jgi:hypothetical protein